MSEGTDRRLSALYRAGAHEVPAQRIDNTILAAARTEPRRSPSTVTRWTFPLALAAVVVLSVSVVMVMRHESSITEEYARGERPDRVARQAASTEKADAVARRPQTASKPDSAIDTQARPEIAKRPEPEARKRAEVDRSSEAKSAKEVTASEAAARNVSPNVQASSPQPPTAASQARTDTLEPAAEGITAPGSSARSETTQAHEAAGPERPQAKVLAPGQAVAPGLGASATRDERRADAKSGGTPAPEQWLRRIEWLRKEGKHAEAEASLAEFRKRYPTYTLPESLK